MQEIMTEPNDNNDMEEPEVEDFESERANGGKCSQCGKMARKGMWDGDDAQTVCSIVDLPMFLCIMLLHNIMMFTHTGFAHNHSRLHTDGLYQML